MLLGHDGCDFYRKGSGKMEKGCAKRTKRVAILASIKRRNIEMEFWFRTSYNGFLHANRSYVIPPSILSSDQSPDTS